MTHFPMNPTPEAIAFQHARRVWEEFHAKTAGLNLGERLGDAGTIPAADITEALRILPEMERTPMAFGVFLKASHGWSASERSVFLDEFLPEPSGVVSGILEAAASSAWKAPEKLPVTLEEFPSRIWKRAVDSGNPARIILAGHQAVLAMLRLHFQYEDQGETVMPDLRKLQPGDETVFIVPSGDLPPVMDLLGIPPYTLPEMKGRVLDWIMDEARMDRFVLSIGQGETFSAWVFADTSHGPMYVDSIVREAAVMIERLNDRKSLHSSHHAQRIGRILFRLGKRHESIRCAKAVGLSPWQQGWQFQSINGAAHSRIRKHLIRPGTSTEGWKSDPALACSAMSIPLWLSNPVSCVPELVRLFNQASSCPWIFPRLHHVYQWHLALAGNQLALGEIETVAPDWSIGLYKDSCQRVQISERG